MVALGVVKELLRRRWIAIGAVSIALHAGGLALLLALAPGAQSPAEPVERERVVELVDVVIDPPAPVVAPKTESVAPRARSSTSEGALGRRGRPTPRHTPSGEPVDTDSLVDLTLSYEAPDNFAPRTGDETDGRGPGTGLLGLGLGAGGVGMGSLPAAPPPPRPAHSRARTPQPGLYPWTQFHDVGGYSGRKIFVRLTIDPHGKVVAARVLRGQSASLDEQAIEVARTFKFEPALDDWGESTMGHYIWTFVLHGDRNGTVRQDPVKRFEDQSGTEAWTDRI